MTRAATSQVLLDSARAYGARGWAVMPVHSIEGGHCTCPDGEGCSSPGKHPRTQHGLKEASTDLRRIQRWWARWPDANVAIVTGAVSGLVVLDVDGYHGGDDTLAALVAEHEPLPSTLQVITGGDGMHYLFAHPGEEIRNTAGKKLGPGLDVRGDGGYVVAAPSLHASGRRYEWVDAEVVPAPMPGWMFEKLRKPLPAAPPAPVPVQRPDSGGTPYGLQALARELAEVRGTAQGGRNHQLNESAFVLGQLVAGGELNEGLVVAELAAAGMTIGLGEGEVAKTIASGIGGGKERPRTAPERYGPAEWVAPRSWEPPPGDDDAPPLDDDHPGRRLALVAGGEGDPPAPGVVPAEDDGPGEEYLNRTDLGNARRLVRAHGAVLHYVPQWKTWLIWNGARWRPDSDGEVHRRAKAVAQAIQFEAAGRPFEERDALRKWALRSEASARLEAMVQVAATEAGIPVDPQALDADQWLLNVLNGTVDLRTGELLKHDPAHLITKMAPVVYDPEARLDMWEEFLEEATDGDEAMVAFLRRAAGYSLTADTGEEKLFFVHGPSASGKSTFLDALQAAMGDYAKTARFETFLAHHDNGGATGDVARLAGARMVMAIEAAEGRKLAEGLVKSLTGGDLVTARFMYQSEFEYRPAFKLWLAANAAPKVDHRDDAMWRRILRVRFEHVVPLERRRPELKRSLRDPASGGPAILAWAVRGCVEWQEEGLGVPPGVEEATEAYREQMDPLADFIDECCVVDEQLWVESGALYKAYAEWARGAGVKQPMTRRAFTDVVGDRGFDRERRRLGGQPKRIWIGIGLADTTTRAADESSLAPAVSPVPQDSEQGELLVPADTAGTADTRDAGSGTRDAVISPASRAKSRADLGVYSSRDAVPQEEGGFTHSARAGSQLSENDVTASLRHAGTPEPTVEDERQRDEAGWIILDRAIGACVVCGEPCRSWDPDDHPRHPLCKLGEAS